MTQPHSKKPVALITGALRGIGRACALGAARAGFHIVLNDLDTDANHALFQALQAELSSIGVESEGAFADVSDLAQHQTMVEKAVERWGRLDCLVNNAGIPPRQRGDLLEVTPESFDACLQVNTRALFFLTQTVASHMLQQPADETVHRSIINITSSNARAVSILRGEYCVSKAAASMVTKLFGLRLANTGIGVYEVRPGIIETDMTRAAKEKYDALIRDHLIPTERWGLPEDVASTVVSMAEGRLRYTVGQAVTVDGGLIIPRF